jgi:hypothetical protein
MSEKLVVLVFVMLGALIGEIVISANDSVRLHSRIMKLEQSQCSCVTLLIPDAAPVNQVEIAP